MKGWLIWLNLVNSAGPSLVEVKVDEEEIYKRFLAAARESLSAPTDAPAPADVTATTGEASSSALE